MGQLVRGAFRRRTFAAALFLATRPLLGTLYLVVLLTMLGAGLFTAIVLIGVPVIFLSLTTAWGFAAYERQLARWWLGAEIGPMSAAAPSGRSRWERVRAHLSNPVTWKSLLYLLLQFPAGMLAFALEVAGLSAALALALAPIWYQLDRQIAFPRDVAYSGLVLWATGTGTGIEPRGFAISLLLGVAGLVLLVWVMHAIGLVGRAWAAAAASLLGSPDAAIRLAEARAAAEVERARAERADQSRRELIVSVSHELRTPIASIRAHVESLAMREDEGRPLDPEAARYLDVIGRETERLSTLVDDLLAVASAESGELELTVTPVSVTELTRHVRDALGPMARRQRGVTLVDRLPEDGLPLVLADADRLTQVMLNLVRNSVAYTPEGGLVSVEARSDGPDGVAISVADTGIGIPPEDLERVFDRFYRTDASRARSTGGFGLGLSIARELIEAMGGTIAVESEVGSGSRFTVRLPVATSARVRRSVGS
jgi:two-component system phosphate regulon sensor histidine kinase PhoR